MGSRPRSLLEGIIRYLAVLTVLAGVLASCTMESPPGQGEPAAEDESSLLSRLVPDGSKKEPPTKEEIKARAEMLANRDFMLLLSIGLCSKVPEIMYKYEQKMEQKMKALPQSREGIMAGQPTGDGTVPSDEEVLRMIQEKARAKARATPTVKPSQQGSAFFVGLSNRNLAWEMLDDYEKMLDDIEKACR